MHEAATGETSSEAALPTFNTGCQTCSNFSCNEDIFAACTSCSCLLCFEHFIRSGNGKSCEGHNEFAIFHSAYIPVDNQDPESFIVEGAPRIESSCEETTSETQAKESRNKVVKLKRNAELRQYDFNKFGLE